MTARQLPVLAGPAGALAAVTLALAGCTAVGHRTAGDMPRPASQTAAAAGHTSPRTAARPGTAVRLASPMVKCADPLGAGGARPAAGGGRAAIGPAAQVAAEGSATASRVMVRRVGVVSLSPRGLVMLCGPVAGHCPPGFRIVYREAISGRPPRLLPRLAGCAARFPLRSLPPEPRVIPEPLRTPPLPTMPP